MKLCTPIAALAIILPGLVFAQTMLDANEDGFISFDELLEMHPETTTELFLTLDTDGDALLNADELAAAQEAGLIPTEDS